MGRKQRISGITCAIENCSSTRRQNIRLFKLKRNNINYDNWVSNCNLKNSTLKCIEICEKHFEKKWFTKRGLKKNAIPTINLPDLPECDNDSSSMLTILSISNLSEIDEMENFQTLTPNRTPNHENLLSVLPAQNMDVDPDSFLSLQEVALLPEPDVYNTDIEQPPCNNCLRNIKNENYYRLKYFTLLKTIQSKDTQISELKRKCNNYLRKIKRSHLKLSSKHKQKTSIEDHINNSNIDENAKNICKMLLSTRSRNQKWPDEQKSIAQNIYYHSTRTYKYLRDSLNLNLPSISSLVRWQPIKFLSPGFNDCVLTRIKEKVNSMKLSCKQAILIFDEIHIKKELVYNIYLDQIDGFVDYGNQREDLLGKLVCCFMIRGLASNWKIVLSYFVSESAIESDKLFLLIKDNLDKCADLGLNIRAVVCDQGPNNRKAFNMLGLSIERPFFYHQDKYIAGIFDVPHLIKSVRNTLLKNDLKCPDGLVSWSILVELFKLERNAVTKSCPKLKYKHIYPNNFDKMRVNYATQIFSRSVAAGLKTAVQLKQILPPNEDTAISTYKFIEKFNNLFDCLNSKTKFDKNQYRCSLIAENQIDHYINYMIEYISGISIVHTENVTNKRRKTVVYCFKGLLQTLQVSKIILKENIGIEYILTSRFNQDPIENLFAQIRAANGNNQNPSVYQFNHNIARLTTVKILTQFSDISNCEADLDICLLETEENLIKQTVQNDDTILETSTNDIEDADNDISEVNENFFCLDGPLEEASMRYYVGYVACKQIRKLKCSDCEHMFVKINDILEAPSEYLIANKNYCEENNFGMLKAPTDLFFNICKEQIHIFNRIFAEQACIKNLKEHILKNALLI